MTLSNTDNFSPTNLEYLEDLYEQFKQDPDSVDKKWHLLFEKNGISTVCHSEIQNKLLAYATAGNYKFVSATVTNNISDNVDKLVNQYRTHGHQNATLDPLKLEVSNASTKDQFAIGNYGLNSQDNDKSFSTDIECLSNGKNKLSEIVNLLETIYCGNIGCEYMHINDDIKRQWMQKYLEQQDGMLSFNSSEQLNILQKLTVAESFEKHLHTTFTGAKRFGLEGGESFIPLLDTIVQNATQYGAKNLVLGMAHRGRLNALVNIFGKLPQDLYDEFKGKKEINYGSGDVKYHYGHAARVATTNGDIDVRMLCNPSHLAIVSPVVEGVARALQDNEQDGNNALPIVVHGDAAVAGQGVIMETLQMSQTRGYTTGGTIHIVINNQVGFTTHEKADVRSTQYCTDVSKVVNIPVIHVNGDDVEAVCFVAKLALAYRMEFKEDIFIDLVCYRRLGHNEADDPTITQPLMYKVIKNHPTTRALYADKLIAQGVIDKQQDKELQQHYRAVLKDGRKRADNILAPIEVVKVPASADNKAITTKKLSQLGSLLTELPPAFSLQKQVSKVIADRKKMLTGESPIDWGCAENLAYASLLDSNCNIRITGQDVARGTFSHRHAVLFDQSTGHGFSPLKNIANSPNQFDIFNSLLSEEGVLAFEYGYAANRINNLTIWEAQFGDFANVAQVVIDQFISSSATKWNQHSNVVMLLPHGYEGQGPEHSSARLERFLQLCAEDNMRVCMPTKASQIFHLLREQALSGTNKPLIVMTPKSLLRHPGASSQLDDLVQGQFESVIFADTGTNKLSTKEKIILSTGKIYYDLIDKVDSKTSVVRVEQLYPFPSMALDKILEQHQNVKTVVWCQDEPANQGSWWYARSYLDELLTNRSNIRLHYAGRDLAASPAAGSMKLHLREQEKLLNQACTNFS